MSAARPAAHATGLRLVEGHNRPKALPGEATVSLAELAKKLGANATQVLDVLRAHARKDGEAHCTYLALQKPYYGRPPLTYPQVHRALARLQAAGLVRWEGRRKRSVPRGEEIVTLRVPVRLVVPARRASSVDPDPVLVPHRTARWLLTACSRGGKRPGAGAHWMRDQTAHKNRRWSGTVRTKRKQASAGFPTDHSNRTGTGPADHSNGTATDPETTIQTVLPISDLSFSSPVQGFFLTEETRAPGEGAPPSTLSRLRRESGAAVSNATQSSVARTHVEVLPDGSVLWPDDPDILLWRRDDGRIWVPSLTVDIVGLPPCPNTKRLPVRNYPAPPPLDPKATDQVRSAALARTYHHVLANRYGTRWPTVDVLLKGKNGERIAETARAMLEHEVAPATWCWWRCDQWDERQGGTRRAPALDWVLSPNAVEKHHGWFHGEEPTFGERPIPNPHRQILVNRYGALYARVVMCSEWPQPVAEREAAAREVFPPGSALDYDALFAAAERHYEREHARLTAMAQDGRWIW